MTRGEEISMTIDICIAADIDSKYVAELAH